MTLKEIASEMTKVRNLSTIIEKKKEEFLRDRIKIQAVDFLEKAIRESVEEALREVIVFKKVGTKNYMEGYEDAMKDLYARIKEFMK